MIRFAHERQTKILALLRKRQRLEFGELQGMACCSAATLRRDLTLLEQQELLIRVHGAVIHPEVIAGEPNLILKGRTAMAAKRRIAQAAARLVADGATVFIDSGTTCVEVARLLRVRPSVTIITNSLPVIAGYAQFQAKLIVVWGENRPVSGALVGGLATSSLAQLRPDVAFIGASGLDPVAGPGTTELLEKEIKAQC